MKYFHAPAVLLLLFGIVTCRTAKFSSDDKRTTPPTTTTETPTNTVTNTVTETSTSTKTDTEVTTAYTLNCESSEPLSVELEGSVDKKVKVSGEFCPKAFGKLSVLFVVDFSGSMGPGAVAPSHPGNDPESNCGRYKAAAAIINKIKSAARSDDNISVGLVKFGYNAQIGYGLRPVAQFENEALAESTFCGADMGSTNFEAAFKKAKEAFDGISGNKVVFFISDGTPTSYDGFTGNVGDEVRSREKGAEAVANLKASASDLTLNMIFLADSNNPTATASAQTYLETLTGDKNRVKVASDASVLADRIVELSIPAIEIAKESLIAELSGGSERKALTISKIERHATKKDVWIFESNEFTLIGKMNETTENIVTVKVEDQSKVVHEKSLTIKFKQK